jgi:hypothetical protein
LSTLALVLVAGCTASADPNSGGATEVASSDLTTSSTEPGIAVDATYRLAFDGTPTIGSEPTVPYLTLRVVVDDRLVREAHPGFDGLERVFVMLPRKQGGVTHVERVELPFDHSELQGFISLYWVDVHQNERLRISTDDLDAVRAEGIAVGLDTNVGTVWAQRPGETFPVTGATS